MSVVSLKNPNDLESVVLINKHFNVSIVILKNLGDLNSIALIVMLVRLREDNRSMGL